MADKTIPTQILTYKYRLLPSKGQHARLRAALDHSRDLYNAALEERIDCYRKTGRSRSRFAQMRALTELRADPEWTTYAVAMQRWPLVQVDLAFQAFFRRLKSGRNPGYPRFKGRGWFKTFGFSHNIGWRVAGGRLILKGIGGIRLHLHRPLPAEPTSCRIKREGRHWFALLTIEAPCAATQHGPSVGIDLGLSSLAALSTGETVTNPRAYKRAQRELRRRQRALARCKRGSKGRRKARDRVAQAHQKIRNTRNTHLHQVSCSLTSRFGAIAIEDLNVKGLARSNFSQSVHDAAWAKLVSMLDYKAAKAGGRVIRVDPKHTSQICPECGVLKPKKLSQRIHKCECGCVMDRDVAAAKVILHRAVVGPGQLNVTGYGERAGGKLVPNGAETLPRVG